jgi:tripartite-type tricarboxylate transporter receptor subunit TctC
VIDNRPGGSTIIGAEFVAKSPADGYTIMVTSGTHLLTSLLTPTPYDAIKDFAAVATTDSIETLLVVHPSVPANNLQEFIALAKSRPGQLNYASSSVGSTNHLSAAMFEYMTGVKMQHVPYKGGGPAVADLISGQVQLFFNSPSSLLPYVKSGKLRAIAYAGDARLPTLPNVPTFKEAGLPGYGMKSWHGVLAPAATPKAIVDKLSAEIAKILARPDTKTKIEFQGAEPYITTPEEFAALMKSDLDNFRKIIKSADMKLEH